MGWESDLLTAIGAPVTATNIANLDAWHTCEGGDSATRNNWINTTKNAPGATSINSVGVKAYPDYTTGLQATASTLLQSNMAGIVAALRQSAPRSVFAGAVGASPWGSNPQCIATTSGGSGTVSPPPSSGGTTDTGSTSTAQLASLKLPSWLPSPFNIPFPIPTPGNPLGAADRFFTLIAAAVTHLTSPAFWIRVGEFLLGGLLILVGVSVMLSETKAAKQVESVAPLAAVATA